jgi:hypothetical protein
MNQKPIPYPPQMRNAAHLPSSPHFDDVADIVANLKAFVSDAIAALAKKAIARCHKADACEKALADEANEQRCHEAARALQEAAAARACQEVAAACAHCQQLLNEKIARARQDDNNDEDDDDDKDKDEDNEDDDDKDYDDNDDDNDDDDNNNDNDDDKDEDAEDEYDNVVGRLKAYAATLFACVDATMAKIQAMDDGFENRAATQEKALANKANKQQQATAWEKALADELCQAAA